ncbi:poly(3-hydroxybutyrate) depolymerase [Arboricoccus pini]|uniref:Poly(3-hydroxybutyrate) depolymerase n=1 Tax=Arboricoccus pini TaxID=1963835 RepID=A0A212S217_9PROT|nr:polyhydroxyalkanoate depolymerase [Arboricoccus pini]SNB79020.1 poly(3-hydroxybutyrate) depolymerase [Arboricoccus pini]
MLYQTYEILQSMMAPWRAQSRLVRQMAESPLNPFAASDLTRMLAAGCELFEDVTKRYPKPCWGISETRIGGLTVPIHEEIVTRTPFCDLLHFDRDETVCGKRYDPKVLLLAPMSGHHATLLRGTVQAMLPEHNLYITDWRDARDVPAWEGPFDLDSFISHVIEFIRFLGNDVHVIAVCQPAVPALAATALMAAANERCRPASLTLMGGPIDTRRNPTEVNRFAQAHGIDWFERNVISYVSWPNPGWMRRVYPGFVQLSGFVSMNLNRHISAHHEYFKNLVKGDCDSTQQHRRFYAEYLAVMDLPAEFYLQTVAKVFIEQQLADGRLTYQGRPVDCTAIDDVTLMTVEGERDDICGLGQTEAAHDLCTNLPTELRYHYVQPGVGHYGVFNGTRWRTEIQPRIREMIRTTQFRLRTHPRQLLRAAS